jgi:hypothetical protein
MIFDFAETPRTMYFEAWAIGDAVLARERCWTIDKFVTSIFTRDGQLLDRARVIDDPPLA